MQLALAAQPGGAVRAGGREARLSTVREPASCSGCSQRAIGRPLREHVLDSFFSAFRRTRHQRALFALGPAAPGAARGLRRRLISDARPTLVINRAPVMRCATGAHRYAALAQHAAGRCGCA